MLKAMIISVGGTPQPIIKSISKFKPEFVSFLSSQETFDKVAEIKSGLREMGSDMRSKLTLVDNPDDLFHCYEKAEQAVTRILEKGYRKDEVIVDYTGGTKNMSVAIALASINHGFSFSYVGGKERTKGGVGVVINGHENVYSSVNPWDFLALEEKKRIAILFNQYQFKAARNLISNLLEKTTVHKSLFKKLGFLIDGYYYWDQFRYRDAIDSFKRAKIDEMIEVDDKSIRNLAQGTEERIGFLNELVNKGKKPSLQLLQDMFSNAERRFEEGTVDDAILRLYRLVEMIAQERLFSHYGIDVSDVRVDKIPAELKDSFMKNYKSERDGKIKIPMAAAYRFLEALGNNVGKLYKANESRFLDIQTARNYSYLAHGFESLKGKTYLTLREFVLSLGILNVDGITIFPKLDL